MSINPETYGGKDQVGYWPNQAVMPVQLHCGK